MTELEAHNGREGIYDQKKILEGDCPLLEAQILKHNPEPKNINKPKKKK